MGDNMLNDLKMADELKFVDRLVQDCLCVESTLRTADRDVKQNVARRRRANQRNYRSTACSTSYHYLSTRS